MALSDLIVRLRADTTDFSRKWADVQRDLNKAAAGAVASTSGFRSFGDVLSRAGTAATAGLTLPLLGVGGAALKVAANLESASTAFTTILKSGAAANQVLGQLRQFALSTPFEFPDLVTSSQRLLAFGFDAKTLIPTLRSVGNAVSSVGGGTAELDRVILALGQIQAKGKLSAEEINQLAETGLPVRDILARSFGVTTAQLVDMTQKGAIPADKAIRALLQGFDSRFGGAMEAQSKTLQGIFSNLKDQVTDTLGTIGAALAPTAKRIATEFVAPTLERLKELAKGFADLPAATQNTILGVTAAVAVAGPAALVFGQLAQGVAAAVSVLKLAGVSLAGVGGTLATATGYVAAAVLAFKFFEPVITKLLSLSGGLADSFKTYLLPAIQSVGNGLLLMVPGAASAFNGLKKIQDENWTFDKALEAARRLSPTFLAAERDVKLLSDALDALNGKTLTLTPPKAANPAKDLFGLPDPTTTAALEAQVKKSQDGIAAGLNQIATNAGKVEAVKLPEWMTRVASSTQAAIAGIKDISPAFANMIKEESFRRYEEGFKVAQKAIADFVLAGTEVGQKLQLDSDFVRFAGGANQLGGALDSLTPRLDNVNAKLIDLLNPGNGANLPNRSSVNQTVMDGLTGPVAQARIEQAGLRAEADRLGSVYTQVAAAAGGSSAEARRAYREWVDAEKKAAEVSETSAKDTKAAFIEVSTVTTNLSQSLAGLIFQGGKFGDVMLASLKRIGESITANLIQNLIKSSGLIQGVSNKLGGVLSKIPGLGKLDGGKAAASAASTVAGGAGTSAASNAVGSAAASAVSSFQSILGLAFQGISAATGIIGNVLAYKTGKDTARLEVTARQIFAEVSNIRTDAWTQHNTGAAFLPGMAEAINRFGDAHSRYLSEILGTLQAIRGGGQLAGAGAGGGGGVTVIVQGNVLGTTVNELADEIARVIARR